VRSNRRGGVLGQLAERERGEFLRQWVKHGVVYGETLSVGASERSLQFPLQDYS
jgi:hypothetical protein